MDLEYLTRVLDLRSLPLINLGFASPMCSAFRLALMSVSSKCPISSVRWKGREMLLLMPETRLHKTQIMSWGLWWISWMESKFKYMLHIQHIGLGTVWGKEEQLHVLGLFLRCPASKFWERINSFSSHICLSFKPWITSSAFIQCQSALSVLLSPSGNYSNEQNTLLIR